MQVFGTHSMSQVCYYTRCHIPMHRHMVWNTWQYRCCIRGCWCMVHMTVRVSPTRHVTLSVTGFVTHMHEKSLVHKGKPGPVTKAFHFRNTGLLQRHGDR